MACVNGSTIIATQTHKDMFQNEKPTEICSTSNEEDNESHENYNASYYQEKDAVSHRPAAVMVRNATKYYGFQKVPVLNNLNMTVEQGTIYSLLGSSGCGKTTVLTCLVGERSLNHGEIRLFGSHRSLAKRSLGYMPQDFALYKDFSIKEILGYFGSLYGIPTSELNSRRSHLCSLLELSMNENTRICNLSGGQKRRVSLAVSMLHSPKLLILDEPTVGVDPILRESIWIYLCQLVADGKCTILLSTHHYEETINSHKIGLMRGGKLLVEENPEILIQQSNAVSLEKVVLQFCKLDEQHERADQEFNNISRSSSFESISNGTFKYRKNSTFHLEEFGLQNSKTKTQKNEEDNKVYSHTSYRHSLERIKALAMKNISVMSRNLLFIGFLILCPAIQILILCAALGNDPHDLNFGFINLEVNCSKSLHDFSSNSSSISFEDEDGCDVSHFSCKYLTNIPSDVINLIEFKTEEDCRKAAQEGKIWGCMKFPENYSDNLYTRSLGGNLVDNETIFNSQIQLAMDMSSKHIALSVKRVLYESYVDFVSKMLTSCGYDKSIGESPLNYNEPIYGTDNTDITEYVAPSALLGIVFFFPLVSSSISYIWDKKQGTLERSRVAGVQTWEIMVAFFMTEGCLLITQLIIVFLILIFVFEIAVQGSITLAIALSLLMGLSGVSMGFLIGSFCNEEMEAVLLAMFTYFPNALLSGMLSPLLSMGKALRYFAYLLPCTLASESIRSIISRGWGIMHPCVYMGFVSTFTWICFYWALTIIIHSKTLSKK